MAPGIHPGPRMGHMALCPSLEPSARPAPPRRPRAPPPGLMPRPQATCPAPRPHAPPPDLMPRPQTSCPAPTQPEHLPPSLTCSGTPCSLGPAFPLYLPCLRAHTHTQECTHVHTPFLPRSLPRPNPQLLCPLRLVGLLAGGLFLFLHGPGLFLDVMGTPGCLVRRGTLEPAGWGPRPLAAKRQPRSLQRSVGSPRAVWTQAGGARGAQPFVGRGAVPSRLSDAGPASHGLAL